MHITKNKYIARVRDEVSAVYIDVFVESTSCLNTAEQKWFKHAYSVRVTEKSWKMKRKRVNRDNIYTKKRVSL